MDPKAGDMVEVKTKERIYKGILMERPELSPPGYVILKLGNGYNIGIEESRITGMKQIKHPGKEPTPERKKHYRNSKKPTVSILSTGGTIASRVDYITGGVYSAFSAEELILAVPELEEIANLHGRQIFNKFSENIIPQDWIKIAKEVAKEIKRKVNGVVITHGTDTMHYTSAALAFILKTPVPVVITGAQRSSDRGSSDAAINLINAVRVATTKLSQVCVVIHSGMSDNSCIIHPATRVRKLHSSRRDAFQTVNSKPLGKVSKKGVELFQDIKKEKRLKLDAKLEEKVALLKYYPGLRNEQIENLIESNYKGIVIEGTGLGHTSESLFRSIKNAIDNGVAVAMTSQTIFGRTNLQVYSTGRRLLELGVIPCEDMLAETALVKMMWVLGHTKNRRKAREIMLKNYAGEITERSEIKEEFTLY